MKPLILILLVFVLISCGSTKSSDLMCSEWIYLKYPVVKKGYIGVDSSPQGDICYQRKWMSYVWLSKNCIIELLGEPAEIKGNVFTYYFGIAEREMTVGTVNFYFQNGKMKKIDCNLV